MSLVSINQSTGLREHPHYPGGHTPETIFRDDKPRVDPNIAAADDYEDERSERHIDTQAVNFLSTLRSRLPEGVLPAVAYEVARSDKRIGKREIIWIFGAWIGNDYICRVSFDKCERVWVAIDELVKESRVRVAMKSESET